MTQHKPAKADVWETIAREAGRESDLWAAALLPEAERAVEPVFSSLGDERFALGLETIYEGYLIHYGRPRLFAPKDRDTNVLLGDYLYAHGLVRIADTGELDVVADLAELLALCAELRAEAEAAGPIADGPVWAASVATLGAGDPRLAEAREALRSHGDPAPLRALAAATAGDDAVSEALSRHDARIPRR